MKTIVVDDNQANINTLCKMIEMYCPEVDIVASARNIEEAYIAIRELKPELLFLDIEMPDGNGFDLLNRFDIVPFEIVFTTAYDQYAVQAFRGNALDYLLKPIEIDALQQAVAKVRVKAGMTRDKDYFEKYMQRLQAGAGSKISIPVIDGLLFVNPQDIIRCEASGSYTRIYMTNGKMLTASMLLKECEERLPKHLFFRTHHSHIINLKYITRYIKGRGGCIIMDDNSSVELSARKKEAFLKFMEQVK